MSASLVQTPIGPAPGAALRFASEGVLAGPRSADAPQALLAVEWLLKRNCSITPRQLLGFYLSLAAVSCAIAALLGYHGAVLVAPFAGVELLAVGACLLVYARHAGDRERVSLRSGRLVVECTDGARTQRVEFTPAWVRVEPCRGDRSLIELSGEGHRIAIGRFVRPEFRRALADELRFVLRRCGVAPDRDAAPGAAATSDF